MYLIDEQSMVYMRHTTRHLHEIFIVTCRLYILSGE